MRYADLHLHTYHSDGTRSPREVIDLARERGLSIVAISDHDNVAAYFEIKPYANECGVTLIAATELSCIVDGHDVHILAYAFDATDERLEQRLRQFRGTRERRGALMVEKLRTLGYPISLRRVEELAAGGALGRPHVARALVEAGHATSVSDAFDRLLGSRKPAFVDKERFRIDEAVALVRAVGGVTSIAHPTLYPNHEALVPRLLDAGVDAIEVFHPNVNAEWSERYANVARFRGKFVTGGSDDHGAAKEVETIGTVRVPESLLGPILERL